jgi:hypothetical protein
MANSGSDSWQELEILFSTVSTADYLLFAFFSGGFFGIFFDPEKKRQ